METNVFCSYLKLEVLFNCYRFALFLVYQFHISQKSYGGKNVSCFHSENLYIPYKWLFTPM